MFGKVAEQDPEPGRRVDELPGPRPPERIALGIGADDLDPVAVSLDDDRLVPQQHGQILEAVELRGPRERIARDGDVVVAEHDVGAVERAEQLLEERQAAGMGDEVTRDADEIRLPPGDPGNRALGRDAAPRGRSEVEVGEVRDPEAVEALRQPVDLDLEHAGPEPAGLEEAVGEQR